MNKNEFNSFYDIAVYEKRIKGIFERVLYFNLFTMGGLTGIVINSRNMIGPLTGGLVST